LARFSVLLLSLFAGSGDIGEAMRRKQPFDLLAGPAADKREPVADRSVFGAAAGVVSGSGEALTSA
jgi:hypothetical protein